MRGSKVAANVDAYIAAQPKQIQPLLEQIRSIIKKAAPKAEETISYMMPAYMQDGALVYFGGCKTHIGFYPTGSGVEAFLDMLKDYKTSKGTIQFQLDKPIPVKLVTQIVKFRIAHNKEKAELKKLKGKK